MAYQYICGGTRIIDTDTRGVCLYTAQTAGARADNGKTCRSVYADAKRFYFSSCPASLLRLSTAV
ncbi:protein of unknown function [Xenorhabdus poinarii G6]|uniref:Uncharacterized protein n=1 Tax=Xenorhabdus poinarii G6 TaxID=1354304 RepID=A0A068R383_9GAMM|nr:protein of unknown function [Xenorhabdus poinarii G6]